MREIAEQKRVDQAVSGTALAPMGGGEGGLDPGTSGGGLAQIQVIMPGDAAKKKHKAKMAIHGKGEKDYYQKNLSIATNFACPFPLYLC